MIIEGRGRMRTRDHVESEEEDGGERERRVVGGNGECWESGSGRKSTREVGGGWGFVDKREFCVSKTLINNMIEIVVFDEEAVSSEDDAGEAEFGEGMRKGAFETAEEEVAEERRRERRKRQLWRRDLAITKERDEGAEKVFALGFGEGGEEVSSNYGGVGKEERGNKMGWRIRKEERKKK